MPRDELTPEPEPRPEPRGISKRVREERFWKDVTTLAGLIVVFVVWGVGIATGVFQSEGAVEGFLRVFKVLVVVFSATLLVAQWRAAARGESLMAAGIKSNRSRTALRPDAFMFLGIGVVIAVDSSSAPC